jgi:hypothetical protein
MNMLHLKIRSPDSGFGLQSKRRPRRGGNSLGDQRSQNLFNIKKCKPAQKKKGMELMDLHMFNYYGLYFTQFALMQIYKLWIKVDKFASVDLDDRFQVIAQELDPAWGWESMDEDLLEVAKYLRCGSRQNSL